MNKLRILTSIACAEQQARSLLKLLPVYINHYKPISTTLPLQRKKQQRKWRPRVPPFHFYGNAHRLVRGLCVNGERYGPLVDKPDYTFLEKGCLEHISYITHQLGIPNLEYGRPTPLTPEQLAERENRTQMAATVMKYMKEIDTVREYNINETPKLKKYRIPERIKGRS